MNTRIWKLMALIAMFATIAGLIPPVYFQHGGVIQKLYNNLLGFVVKGVCNEA